MWYKLPYEDISEKELLENGKKNKKRMASNGRYYGELDVFIEKPETSVVIVDGAVLQDDEVDGNELDVELQDDEVDGDDEAEESEDEFWKLSGADRIEAPPYKRPPGRAKGKARIKGVRESPKKNQTKVDRKGRICYCGLCGGEDHNSRKCPRESDESRKRRRLNMKQQSHEQEIEDVSSNAPPATQP
ncbi:hypothetical protein HID58_090248 [Brassica napus]|uniref:CCHC-type domain-containing protein n=1 Tax=Brassica napus TaxID=3708 RepID=A0ABQ7X9W0_BRANA|nr:hypothetical protein HID58_090248 [Brassica napus]